MERRCDTPIPDMDVLMKDIFDWEIPNHITKDGVKKIASSHRDDGNMDRQIENQSPRGVKKITLPSWIDTMESTKDCDTEADTEVDKQVANQIDTEVDMKVDQHVVDQIDTEVDNGVDQKVANQIDAEVVMEVDQHVVDQIDTEVNHEIDSVVNYLLRNGAKGIRPLTSLGLERAFHFSPTSRYHQFPTAPAFSRALEVQNYRNAPMTARGPGLNRMCFRSRGGYLRACTRLYGDLSRKRDISGGFVEADPFEDSMPSSSSAPPVDDDSVIKYRRLDTDRARVPAQRAVTPDPQTLTINTDITNECRNSDKWPLTPDAELSLSAQSDRAHFELPPIPANDNSDSPVNSLQAPESSQQLPLIWQYYYATLNGSMEQIRALQRVIMDSYANPIANAIRIDLTNFYRHRILILRDRMHNATTAHQGMRKTVANALNSALSFAGTAAQRALALVKHRRPARQTRPDTRGLTIEHLRRLKLNEWRKDRGNDVLEEFPFPDLRRAFDSPQVLANIKAAESPSVEGAKGDLKAADGPPLVKGGQADDPLGGLHGATGDLKAADGPPLVVGGQADDPLSESQSVNGPRPVEDPEAVDQVSVKRSIVQAEFVQPQPHSTGDAGSCLASCGEEYPLGRPISAISLCRPLAEPLPDGRTESIWTEQFKVMEAELREKLQLGKDQNGQRILLEGLIVRGLSEESKKRVLRAMSSAPNKVVATTLSGDSLRKDDLGSCYNRMAWLNDEVINAYLEHIVDFQRRRDGNTGRHVKPLYHAFNTFFFSNLRDKGYNSVQRWATRAKIGGPDLLNVKMVLIPVHNHAHWTMVVLRPMDRTIEHFDSLGPRSIRIIGKIKQWLQGELGPLYKDKEWTVPETMGQKQDNGSDCGVFALITAKSVALGIDPASFGPTDMGILRKKIVAELLNGGLLDCDGGDLTL